MSIGSTDTMEVQVSINGDQMPGLLRASIATTNCFSADTYSLTFAIGGPENIAFWSTISSAYLEVTAVASSCLVRHITTSSPEWPTQFMSILSSERLGSREEICHLRWLIHIGSRILLIRPLQRSYPPSPSIMACSRL